jgi:hypothetical protein
VDKRREAARSGEEAARSAEHPAKSGDDPAQSGEQPTPIRRSPQNSSRFFFTSPKLNNSILKTER